MIPEKTINVVDSHGGFTAITKSPTFKKVMTNTEPPAFLRWDRVWEERDTLWRPAQILKGQEIGELQEYKEDSFFQNNNDVTMAFYKVKGYSNRVVLWFDNKTRERIA